MDHDDFPKQLRYKFSIIAKSTLGNDFQEDKSLFSITNEHFNFHLIIFAKGTIENVLIFAEKVNRDSDEIYIQDVVEQTKHNLNIKKIHQYKDILSFFAANHILSPLINIDNINPHSIYLNHAYSYPNYINIDLYAEHWAESEFNNTFSTLSKKQFEILKFDSSLLHYHEYNFTDMINVVSDEQFTGNLNQILGAYNKGWFYIAATGMGGLIEMLLYKTAINYDKPDFKRDKKDGLTKMNYAEKLRQLSKLTKNLSEDQKIHFESYDELTLDRDYLTRNAVSHFSTGFVNKKEVDSLFTALKNVYSRYFIPSTKYLEEHPELFEQN